MHFPANRLIAGITMGGWKEYEISERDDRRKIRLPINILKRLPNAALVLLDGMITVIFDTKFSGTETPSSVYASAPLMPK